jgi:hypothetical protein
MPVSDLPDTSGAHAPTLVELVNRVVDRGVSLSGDLTISVADIDLIYLGLRLVLRSAIAPDSAHEGGPRFLPEASAVPEGGDA